jgi:N-acetylglucosamine kinase-like BadF-type ATPase
LLFIGSKYGRWVYKDTSWARIASVVPVVKACAAAGDAEARKVLTLAVEGLATSVRAVVNRLNLAGKGKIM